jgi:hypothetical protein
MKTFSQYLSEAAKEGHGLHVFDVDDTLFHTTARVKVMHGKKEVGSLSNSEYNTHKLPKDHHYDYSEFRSAEKFDKESKPMTRMLSKMRAIHSNAKKTGSKVVIATARADFDDKEKFLNAFRKHGVDMDNIQVHRAGNDKSEGTIAEKKARIISRELKAGGHKRASLYDDSKDNLKHFLALKKDHPDVELKAFHVQPNGSVVRHTEE